MTLNRWCFMPRGPCGVRGLPAVLAPSPPALGAAWAPQSACHAGSLTRDRPWGGGRR